MEEKNKKEQKRGVSISRVLILFGAAAVVIAALIFMRTLSSGRQDTASAKEVETAFRERVPFVEEDQQAEAQGDEEYAETDSGEASMAVLRIDGHSCVGLLQVTGRDLSWVVENISGSGKILPCLISGTPQGGACTILGSDESGNFGDLPEIAVGDEITFTDVYGKTTKFVVQTSGTIEEDKMEPTDLNLFCEKSMGRIYLVSCSKE